MINVIRVSVSVMLVVNAGIVHGAWTNRWSPSRSLTALAARFESVPMVIGDWKATELEMDPRERAMVGGVACLSRVNANQSRGVAVSVVLLGGLRADISRHTPHVCNMGAGFILNSSSLYPFHYGVDEQRRGEFQTAVATRQGTNPSVVRVFWGWNASKGWAAPSEPRWTYGSAPALCKLYVARETAGALVDPGVDPCNDILRVFLPELDRFVFATSK
jgi:Protein of unknown function (DUF3485)